ncbi:MAG: hypothetical protein ACRYF9_26505 [Janthinobacterium lividum]
MHEPRCVIPSPTASPHREVTEPCYCTVVFDLPGGHPAITRLLHELSQHFELPGTAFVVKFEVGDKLLQA